ncbi:MAG: hypothetical protein EOO04_10020 [Chitinophagaceae bacterium]|nr:MAG: hypothetical protein EOO04_10020 [Chitinophagaceae bacterium]
MKNLLLALAVTGASFSAAEAQSSANSKYAKNYPVCLVGNSYQLCQSGLSQDIGRTTEEVAYISMENTYVHLGASTNQGNARFRSSRIRVTYDDPGAAYEGKESMINDGIKKNKIRNINTNNGGYDLPPNDGGR